MSFVSIQLLDAVNPDLEIHESDQGQFVFLHLIWEEDEYEFEFNVINSGKFEMVLGGNHLENYELSEEGLMLPGGVATVYQR